MVVNEIGGQPYLTTSDGLFWNVGGTTQGVIDASGLKFSEMSIRLQVDTLPLLEIHLATVI